MANSESPLWQPGHQRNGEGNRLHMMGLHPPWGKQGIWVNNGHNWLSGSRSYSKLYMHLLLQFLQQSYEVGTIRNPTSQMKTWGVWKINCSSEVMELVSDREFEPGSLGWESMYFLTGPHCLSDKFNGRRRLVCFRCRQTFGQTQNLSIAPSRGHGQPTISGAGLQWSPIICVWPATSFSLLLATAP